MVGVRLAIKVDVQVVDSLDEAEYLYEFASDGDETFKPKAREGQVVFRRKSPGNPVEARSAGASVVDEAAKLGVDTCVVDAGSLREELIFDFLLGIRLAGYRYDIFQNPDSRVSVKPNKVQLRIPRDPSQFDRALIVAESVALARDLANDPPSRLTPTRFASIAASLADEYGIEVRIWDKADCERERLGGLLGVARGSTEEPRAVKLVWRPENSKSRVALVGKGITFDSGGLSLKSAEGMTRMKTDMSGAAAVLATVVGAARQKLDVEVAGYLMLAENMPSGSAQKPGDVLVTRSGKTIEVLNTDAEGRLVLADGLTLACEDGYGQIVDIATLTGACVVALGDEIAGLFANDDQLMEELRKAGEKAQEPSWPLPLPKSYDSHIKSEIADMKNIGKPGKAGAISAALLLERFCDGVKWAHLDIAGPARSDSDRGWIRQGPTGFSVLTLLEWLGMKV